MIREHCFVDREEQAAALSAWVAENLRRALDEKPLCSLALSGGSTPARFLRHLGEQDLDWSRVRVTLADERWVPLDHPASNERLVRNELLCGRAREAQWVGLRTTASTPETGCSEIEERVRPIRPFEVVSLGMGTDGHLASLFPASEALEDGLDPASTRSCLPVHRPAADHPRMSLTLAALTDSRRVVLQITGERKWEVYQNALEDGPENELPLRAVLRYAREVEVYWAP